VSGISAAVSLQWVYFLHLFDYFCCICLTYEYLTFLYSFGREKIEDRPYTRWIL
jgi:hypothetical protein